nr:MAG TPA_asm: hypothetical protein [Bacteriophage sp.]
MTVFYITLHYYTLFYSKIMSKSIGFSYDAASVSAVYIRFL